MDGTGAIDMLRSVAELEGQKPQIMAAARRLMPEDDGTVSEGELMDRAKMAAVQAVRDQAAKVLREQIEAALADALLTHEIIWGERAPENADVWDEALDDAVAARLGAVRGVLGEARFAELAQDVGLHQPGRAADVAAELSAVAAEAMASPDPGSRSKWLASVGIMKPDIEALTKPGDPEEAFGPAPERDDLVRAFNLLYQATDRDIDQYAARMQISRNTFMNWVNGKTRPNPGIEGAKSLLADIDRRTAELQEAAQIFARVRK